MEHETQYLVTPGEETDIAVMVCGAACESGGALFFLTDEEAAIRFPLEGGASFSVGQPVTVSLTSDRLGAEIQLPGLVKFRRDEDHARMFRIPFAFDGDEGANLQRRLGKLNRRKEMRVPPTHPDEVKVELRPAQLDDDGMLVGNSPHAWQAAGMEVTDMSFHGVGVTAGFETDLTLAETVHVELRLTFPDPLADATVVGFLRSRILDGVRVRYGIEITGQHTEEYLRQEDAVAQYVWKRMRELFGSRPA